MLMTDGDGLDSNGDIYIYGGNIEVWGMRSGGDNEPLDHDGTLEIYNATLLGDIEVVDNATASYDRLIEAATDAAVRTASPFWVVMRPW